MRKLLLGIVGLVVLLVVAALIVPSVIDWNSYKADIAAQAKQATGRDLDIRGNLDLALLPSPRLSVADVRFASIPGATEPDMVRLKSLDVRVKILPLLQGRIEVASVTLVEPVIVLEKLADGRTNWTLAPQGGAAPPPGGQRGGPAPPGPGAGAPAIGVDSLRIRGGTVIWRDGESKTTERIEKLDAEVAAASLAGPVQLKGSLVARDVPLNVSLAIGRLVQDGAPAPVSLALQLPQADAKAEFSGTLAGPFESARLNGRFDASGKNLARVVAAFAAPDAAPGMLAQPFALRMRVNGSQQGGALSDLELEVGGAHATGEVAVAIGERVRADAKLRIARIDLGRWLAPAAGAAPPGTAKPATSTRAPAPAAGAAAAPFALPANVNGSLDLTVAAITWDGDAIQDVRLVGQLAEGAVTLKQASMRLPGGGEASLTGFLAAKSGRPDFDGTLDVRADNLRALLGWMKLDITGVPADRLRKFALTTRLKGDDRQLQVLGAKISLDTSRIDAGVTLALRERVAFGASVNVNQLNLDAYMPAAGQGGAAKPAPAAGSPAAPPAAGAASPAAGPLAALNGFDANLRLNVASLTYNRTAVRDLRFDGTLSQGTLTIRDASIGNLAGTAARINGTLTGFDRIPVFRGGFAADSNNISGVMRVAGLEPPPAARSLGKVSLRGKADGGAERVKLDATLDVAGGKLAVAGTLDGLPATPRFDARITADHGDPARLARAFGMDLPTQGKLGPLSLEAALKGDEKALTADAKLKALGGEVALAGGLTGLAIGKPALDGTFKLAHPSFNVLMQGLAPDYRPSGRNIGPVRIEAKLKGAPEGAELTGLVAQAGKAQLNGNGRLALDGPRPKLVAALTGGQIDLNPFLPTDQPARSGGRDQGRQAGVPGPGGGGPARQGERFSSEPFDLAALGDADADLSIGAESILWKNFRVDKPAVKMMLADSLLTIEQMAGKMFDGAFLLKGKLNAKGRRPAVEGSVNIEKANVGKALFDAASFDIASGIMDFTMALAGSGESPKAMVAALGGDGRLNVQNGVVKGFDLTVVSERLKNIDRGLDILKLFGAAMGGGETRFSRLDGTFRMEKGVLRTNDLKMVAQAGEGTATGFADLPRWNMDFDVRFRLTEHPNTPPFGMKVRGPIDNPQRIFQVQDLQSHLLQRGVGTLLRKLVPEKKPEQQQAPQQAPQEQQQQQQRQKPEDILRGLLKGLGR